MSGDIALQNMNLKPLLKKIKKCHRCHSYGVAVFLEFLMQKANMVPAMHGHIPT